MRRPRLLDLCCGGGGASAGYHAAGFDVTGVDSTPQDHYPYRLIVADALCVDLAGYDVIAASPPCQRWSRATPESLRANHPDILTPLRERLIATGRPYVIENVPGAPLRSPVSVCGETLRLGVRRHRLFESNVALTGVPCVHDRVGRSLPVYGSRGQPQGSSVEEARAAMGIGWLPWPRLVQAIPPVYAFTIGLQLMARIRDGCDLVDDLESRDAIAAVSDLERDASPPAGYRHGNDLDCSSSVTIDLDRVASVIGRCPRCGGLLRRPETGRWPRFCSHACRQAAYRWRQSARNAR